VLYPDLKLCFSNSSGIFLGKRFHFDLCRPGAALYGINPTPAVKNPMRTVVHLRLPVIQLKIIPAGDFVGYGATYVAKRQTKLAVTFGGYADGIFRAMSNKVCGRYREFVVPLVGRVSMDMAVFDVTDVPVEPEFIELLNVDQGVDYLASCAGTIGYEILTSLGARYKREYIN
jgi:alanine racemase